MFSHNFPKYAKFVLLNAGVALRTVGDIAAYLSIVPVGRMKVPQLCFSVCFVWVTAAFANALFCVCSSDGTINESAVRSFPSSTEVEYAGQSTGHEDLDNLLSIHLEICKALLKVGGLSPEQFCMFGGEGCLSDTTMF